MSSKFCIVRIGTARDPNHQGLGFIGYTQGRKDWILVFETSEEARMHLRGFSQPADWEVRPVPTFLCKFMRQNSPETNIAGIFIDGRIVLR